MEIRAFILVTIARWRVIASCVITAVVAACVVNFFAPSKYTATSTVLLDVRTPDPVLGTVFAGTMMDSYMATQVDVIGSDLVARRAINYLKLTEDPGLKAKWTEEAAGDQFEDWIVEQLLKKLEVRPAKESSTINISFVGSDPGLSSRVANAFTKAYIDESVELRTDPARKYNSMFEDGAKRLRETVSAANERLTAYQRINGLLSTDERLDSETTRLNNLQAEVVAIQSATADSTGKANQGRYGANQMSEVRSDPVVSALATEIAREEARLREIAATLGGKNPKVESQQSKVDELHRKIQEASDGARSGLLGNATVGRARLDTMRQAVEVQKARVLEINRVRDHANALKKDVDNAQNAYDAMLDKVNQTSIQTVNTQTNVSILRHAISPTKPTFPRPSLNLAAAIVLGAFAGTIAALICEILDRRVRSAVDISYLGQPLLGIISGRRLRSSVGQLRRPMSVMALVRKDQLLGTFPDK